jgi:hypothetical protein
MTGVRSERAHLLGRLKGTVQLLLPRTERHDALGALVVVQAGVAAQLLQRAAAVGAPGERSVKCCAGCAPKYIPSGPAEVEPSGLAPRRPAYQGTVRVRRLSDTSAV